MFSSSVRLGQVPAAGFWKMRPMLRQRLYSLRRLTFLPSMSTCPPSTGMLPQRMFSSEVLPLPLLPTMATNWPSRTVRLKSRNSVDSVISPGL